MNEDQPKPSKDLMEMIKGLTDKVYNQALDHAIKIVSMYEDVDNPIPKITIELNNLKSTPTP